MHIRCPHCQNRFDIAQSEREELFHDLVDLAVKFGPSWDLANEYAKAFRQSEYGKIPLEKRVRLLKDIWHLFETCEYQFDSRRYRTDRTQIIEAMKLVCNYEKWKFKDHNYLKTILLKGADRLSAEGMTAKEEQKMITRIRDKPEETESSKDYLNRMGVSSLVDMIGKKMPEKEAIK